MLHISSLINNCATKLQEVSLKEQFYVFVPSADKPRVIHNTYKDAFNEARRLQDVVISGETIEILQVVKRLEAYGIPF
ncbi:MAG: hypothetical protein J6Q32_05970 [Clostridia bacterium]|nr:hypothetical protein [Clostridia bacterium]